MSKPRIIKNSNNIDTIDTSEKFFLSNEIILNSDLSFDARLAYIALRYYKTKVDYVIYDYLAYVLSGEINNPKLRKENIKFQKVVFLKYIKEDEICQKKTIQINQIILK